MKLFFLTLLFSLNYVIRGKPEIHDKFDYSPRDEEPVTDDSEGGWWGAITNPFSSWYAEEEESDDNSMEIENSVKLTEMFPYLKEQLNSTNEEEQQQARDFIKSMNEEIQQKKRYTHIFWKGMQRIIDMGKLKSPERRDNEKETFWLFDMISRFFSWIKSIIFGESDSDGDKDKAEKNSKHSKDEDDETAKSKKDVKSDDKKSATETEKSNDTKAKQSKRGIETKSEHNEVPYPVSLTPTPPPSEPTIGIKDELDRQASKHEIVHKKPPPEHHESVPYPITLQPTPPPNNPEIGLKDELDRRIDAMKSHSSGVHTDVHSSGSQTEVIHEVRHSETKVQGNAQEHQ